MRDPNLNRNPRSKNRKEIELEKKLEVERQRQQKRQLDRDRDQLRRERKQKSKKRKKAKKRLILLRRIALVVICLVVIFFLARFVIAKVSDLSAKLSERPAASDKAGKEGGDEEIKFSLDDEKDKDPVKKRPKLDPNISFDDMKKDLNQRLDTFLKGEKIAKDAFSIGYFNLQTYQAYGFNEDKTYNIGRSNNFMIAMDIYDMAVEKNIDLDEEIDIGQKTEDKDKLPKRFTLRELIKLMVTKDDEEARDFLIEFIEKKSSKNWYDELSTRFGVDLSYTNKMSPHDSLKVLRRLFSERRMTAEERIKAEEEKDESTTVYVYLELINFMAAKPSSSPLISSLARTGQASDNYGKQYEDQALMGFVLGEKEYIYVVMSSNTKQTRLYDALNIINQWQDYYYK